MKVAFAGTPEFARAALQRIVAAHGAHEVPLVLTQPDRPAGRGLQLQPSPVKEGALAHGIAIAQPRGLRLDGRFAEEAAAARTALEAAAPDVLLVAAYGLILPRWVLELPRFGCLNIHASLLPRWRGAAPIHRAIEAGDTRTGITLMQMDAGLDTGPMLLEAAEPIHPDDTTGTLHDRLAALGARLVVEALERLSGPGLIARPQPQAGATYARKIDKAEAAIDWQQPGEVIERRLRAFDPAPGAHTTLGSGVVKCWRAEVAEGRGAAGEVLRVDDAGPVVACGEGALRLTELQRAGGKRIGARAFLQGTSVVPGMRLGGEPSR